MTDDIRITKCSLEVKAIGKIKDISEELKLPDGKCIEELLDDQEKDDPPPTSE